MNFGTWGYKVPKKNFTIQNVIWKTNLMTEIEKLVIRSIRKWAHVF
jgi:hypothetical protein